MRHLFKHVPRQVLRNVPGRQVLEHVPEYVLKHMPKHMFRHVPDKHMLELVPEHVLKRSGHFILIT